MKGLPPASDSFESSFELHKRTCKQCRNVDLTRSATLGAVCHDMARSLRDFFAETVGEKAKKALAARNLAARHKHEENRGTKKKVQELTRYVEPDHD